MVRIPRHPLRYRTSDTERAARVTKRGARPLEGITRWRQGRPATTDRWLNNGRQVREIWPVTETDGIPRARTHTHTSFSAIAAQDRYSPLDAPCSSYHFWNIVCSHFIASVVGYGGRTRCERVLCVAVMCIPWQGGQSGSIHGGRGASKKLFQKKKKNVKYVFKESLFIIILTWFKLVQTFFIQQNISTYEKSISSSRIISKLPQNTMRSNCVQQFKIVQLSCS